MKHQSRIPHVELAQQPIEFDQRTGEGNLLELAVEAARQRASLGEISYACEKVYGRYKAVVDYEGRPYVLYDLESDPQELNNIIEKNRDRAQELARALMAQLKKEGQQDNR